MRSIGTYYPEVGRYGLVAGLPVSVRAWSPGMSDSRYKCLQEKSDPPELVTLGISEPPNKWPQVWVIPKYK